MSNKKAYIICPVRKTTKKMIRIGELTVAMLERQGYEVYYPPRDTVQDQDPIGYDICQQNLNGIHEADEIFIIWDGKSTGSLFDAGIAFALSFVVSPKKITCIHVPPRSVGKSFQNMLRKWEEITHKTFKEKEDHFFGDNVRDVVDLIKSWNK